MTEPMRTPSAWPVVAAGIAFALAAGVGGGYLLAISEPEGSAAPPVSETERNAALERAKRDAQALLGPDGMARASSSGKKEQLPDSPALCADLAAAYRRHGRYDMARRLLATAVKQEPVAARQGQYCMDLATLAVEEEDGESAQAWFRRALETAGDTDARERYYLAMAAACERAGNLAEGRRILQEALEDASTPAARDRFLRMLVAAHRRAGKLSAFVAPYEAKLEADPEDRISLGMLALVYWDVQHDGQKAGPVLAKQQALSTSDAAREKYGIAAGQAYLLTSTPEAGLAPLKIALAATEGDPARHSRVLRLYGEVCRKAGRLDEAYDAFDAALKAAVDPAAGDWCRRQILEIEEERGGLSDLAEKYRKHLAENRSDPVALRWLAEILARIGGEEREEAVTLLRQAISMRPRDTHLRLQLAELFASMENPRAAAETLKTVLSLDSAQRQALAGRIAELLTAAGDKEDAHNWAKTAASLRAEDPQAALRLARLSLINGRREEADAAVASALTLAAPGIDRARIRLAAARLYRQNGAGDRSEAILREILAAPPSKDIAARAKADLIDQYRSENRLDTLKLP